MGRAAETLAPLEFALLGVKVHALQPGSAVEVVTAWLEEEPATFHAVSSTNVHTLVQARESERFMAVMRRCDISLPDGMPLVWYGRRLGHTLPERCGIEEVMTALFELSNHGRNFRHYFFGSTPEVLRELRAGLLRAYPRLDIVGMQSPPFRELTAEEEQAAIAEINRCRPDFLWVGLGCPRQETWLEDHRHELRATVGGGAGAVFDFLSGSKPRPPRWVRHAGMEWLFRLSTDPGRLWRRYLLMYPKCLVYLAADVLRGGAGRS